MVEADGNWRNLGGKPSGGEAVLREAECLGSWAVCLGCRAGCPGVLIREELGGSRGEKEIWAKI